MSDVITAFVPLSLASPKIVFLITKLVDLLAYIDGRLGSKTRPVLYQQTDFKASFCLSTEEYRKTWEDHPDGASVAPLSVSLVARDALLSWPATKPRRAQTIDVDKDFDLLPTTHHPPHSRRDHDEEDQHFQRGIQQLQQATQKMNEWMFEENGVRVRCGLYVGAVSAVAAVLVLGGIAAGLTIGERLPGVDPFNIATFCWVLAAFVILVAKSMRMASWTWWDFLHCQVLCRSVSELREVTGIDDQLILARLLHDESHSRLLTQGPYNAVFTRKATAGGGFAIDRPVGIRTMLLSGLVMLQVQAPFHGKYLVCMDLRKGTDFCSILHARDSAVHDEERIVSDKLVDKKVSGSGNRIVLKKEKASWYRIIGVYGQKDAVFC